jgi:predicted PurR-regulated permease PerM
MDRVLLRTLFLFAATLVVLWAFLLVLSPFLAAIAWALCLAAVTYPLYVSWTRRLGRPRIVALLLVLLTGAAILVPAAVVTALAANEAFDLAEGGFEPYVARLKAALPSATAWAEARLERMGTSLREVAQDFGRAAPRILARPLAAGVWSVFGGLLVLLFGLVVTLATQFFVYTEGPRLKAFLADLSPLGAPDTDRILETLRRTTVAAVLGGLLVAGLQGTMGAIGFAIVGFDAAVLWGLVMAFAALVPAGGAALVWVPAVVFLFFDQGGWRPWFLLVWGVLLVSGLDNVLRPWILARAGATVHPLLLFFAVISGIGLFGVSGIVFGPLLIAFLLTVVHIYREHVAPEMGGEDRAPVTPE